MPTTAPTPEPHRRPPDLLQWFLFGFAVFCFILVFSGQCAMDRFAARAYPSRLLPAEPEPELLAAPPLDDEYLPCDDCHGDEPADRTRRELEEHDFEFKHGDLWCLDCHTINQYQQLHLSDDTLLEFEESWRLCTRCHGKKLPDWRAGVHGKRTGHWQGPKQYLTCVACHRPHSPRTELLEPKPRPWRSDEILPRLRAQDHEVQDEEG
jgi:hypothetical protein